MSDETAEDLVTEFARLAKIAGARLDAVNEVRDELKEVTGAVVDLTDVMKAQPTAEQYKARIDGLEKLLDERDRELKNRTFRTNMAMLGNAVLVLAFLVVITLYVRTGSLQREEIRRCTEPGHACYARAQRQNQKAINKVRSDTRSAAIAAVECSPLMPDDTAFEQCLDAKVTGGTGGPAVP